MEGVFSACVQYGAVGICVLLIIKEVYIERIHSARQSERDDDYNATIKDFRDSLNKFCAILEGLRTEISHFMPNRFWNERKNENEGPKKT